MDNEIMYDALGEYTRDTASKLRFGAAWGTTRAHPRVFGDWLQTCNAEAGFVGLHGAPDMLSMGERVMPVGFTFVWRPGSSPFSMHQLNATTMSDPVGGIRFTGQPCKADRGF